MTHEEYYNSKYSILIDTEHQIAGIINEIRDAYCDTDDLKPIVYSCSRIKSPDSMIRKLAQRGFPTDSDSALKNVYDAVGVRVICSFESDVQSVVEMLEKDDRLTIMEKKDYLSFPKPNGYRSIHLCLRVNESGVPAEIQIRTIAMDFWATLEHQLKYKKQIKDDELIRNELKRCADEIASVDISMQTIRDILKDF